MKLCQLNVLNPTTELMAQVISTISLLNLVNGNDNNDNSNNILKYLGDLYKEENIKDFARVVKGGTKGDGVDLVTADGVSSVYKHLRT